MERNEIDTIRRSASIKDIVGQAVKLKRVGRGEFKGLCPFHNEKSPSFTVNETKRFFHCFGCGAHGDVVDFVMRHERIPFLDAIGKLSHGTIKLSPDDLAAKVQAEEREQEAAEQRVRENARRIWDKSVPIKGTPAEKYLNGRAIHYKKWPVTLRYCAACQATGTLDLPALVCARLSVDRQFVGIWRIFLQQVEGRWEKYVGVVPPRMGLGKGPGSAVWLEQPRTDTLVISEGVEDGLAIRSAVDLPVWCGTSTSGMRGMILPAHIRRAIICPDRDEKKFRPDGTEFYPGDEAARFLAERLTGDGLDVRIAPPPLGKDYNDTLRGTL